MELEGVPIFATIYPLSSGSLKGNKPNQHPRKRVSPTLIPELIFFSLTYAWIVSFCRPKNHEDESVNSPEINTIVYGFGHLPRSWYLCPMLLLNPRREPRSYGMRRFLLWDFRIWYTFQKTYPSCEVPTKSIPPNNSQK